MYIVLLCKNIVLLISPCPRALDTFHLALLAYLGYVYTVSDFGDFNYFSNATW